MKAVVMAGGEGTRLRPLTLGRPKPMVPLVNRSMLEHILLLLKRHGITDVVLTVQYMASYIQTHIGDGSDLGMNVTYSVEEHPLGTAGSVRQAAESLDDTFLVISGDALTDFDLHAAIEFHRSKGAMATLTLHRVLHPLEYGVVVTDGDGRIKQFQEKPSWSEVVTDTINTGIYVLEPSVFEWYARDQVFDFSKDLFPLLLKEGKPLYGYVADGYWTDVGSIEEYVRATRDVLEGKVGIEWSGQQVDGTWREGGVEIAQDARIIGPVYLGRDVRVKDGAVIHGPTAIQANSVVERRANVDRSVVWQNTSIDEHAEIRGSLLGVECTVQANAVIFEGAVIGDQTVIRRGAIIQPNVKIWPHKEVEAGAVVSSSIIWGSAGRRTLFGRFGVSGLINVDFTPEVMAKLGSAYASTLPLGCDVTVNRDLAIPSRMLERALASGLPSAGVNVVDLSAVPIPVARYYTAGSGAVGGVHVRTSSDDPSVIHINFFDRDGMDLDKGIQRKVESAYFREDVRRAQLEDIGTTSYASGVVWRYTEAFMEVIDRSSMEHSPYRLVVDYDRGPTSDVLLPILRSLGCDVVDLNAGSGFTRAARSQPEYVTAFEQLATIVPALHFDLGAMLNVTGEKLHIVDGTGRKLPEMQMLVALACLVFQQYEGATVAVPVDAPTIFESLATRYGGKVLRTRLDPQSIMAAARQKHVRLAGDGRGCTIFPEFHGAYDGMYTLVKLLELLRRRRTTIQDVVGGLPSWHIKETDVPCPWDKKGQVMRVLGEQYRERGDLAGIPAGYPAPGLGDPLGAPRRGDTRRVPDSPSPTRGSSPDGIKIQLGDDWVLILPDPDEPQVHLVTQAHSEREAQTLVDKYVGIVTGLQV